MTPRGDPPEQPPARPDPAGPDTSTVPTVALPVVVAVDRGAELVAAIDAAWAAQDRAREIGRALTPCTAVPSMASSPLGRRR
ncbi:hypothetical protein R8Z50_23295 [Longispora sp. K20-0274]|uniref:hypothetical protein n=1 Tax=Longispora sp. K20-0274 TaxID=3088255 RepID=UPI00399BC205